MAVRVENGAAALENNVAVALIVKRDPAISLLGIYARAIILVPHRNCE